MIDFENKLHLSNFKSFITRSCKSEKNHQKFHNLFNDFILLFIGGLFSLGVDRLHQSILLLPILLLFIWMNNQ